MTLHNYKEAFVQLVKMTSEYFSMDPALIEKDYFVTLFLRKANEAIPGLVFKGGTSLSKCFKIIDRFSEDIDLTLDTEHFSQTQKRNAVKKLIEVSDNLNFSLINRNQVEEHSHGNNNCYHIQYPNVFMTDCIAPELKAEMTYIQKSYPCEMVKASSYIADFLLHYGNDNVVSEFNMNPFDVKVQSLERTLIDKLYALGDYYLSGLTLRNSRHIYDISKLLSRVELDNPELKILAANVRNERKVNKTCLSAQDDVNMQEILQKIISDDVFKKDYYNVTALLLTKPLHYEVAIQALKKVVDSKLFL